MTQISYEMEDLVSIVAKLAAQYTGPEHTSVTYEKADQLMEAVLYCIHELTPENSSTAFSEGRSLPSGSKISAQQAYEAGLDRVTQKVQSALCLYNKVMQEFLFYENRCLYDTFAKGIPEFFKWYDVRFAPQHTILTLDYPVLRDLSSLSGIDRISEFIRCVSLEQTFLKRFPPDYVTGILRCFHPEYRDMIENICEPVYAAAAVHMLAEKPITADGLCRKDCDAVCQLFSRTDNDSIRQRLMRQTGVLIQNHYDGNKQLLEYLEYAANNTVVRLRAAAKTDLPALIDRYRSPDASLQSQYPDIAP